MTAPADRFASDLDAVLADTRALLVAKNAAYGDSALNPLCLFAGDLDVAAQIRVRIDDKLSRLARGTAAGEDVELDLLGYLLLLRIARRRGGPGGGHEKTPGADAPAPVLSSPATAPPPSGRPAPPRPASSRGPLSASTIRAARHYFERRERQWSGVPAGTSWAAWLASPEGVAWASGCNAATPATGAGSPCNAPAATPATPPSSPSHSPSPSTPEVPEVRKEEEDAHAKAATPATGSGNGCNAPPQRPAATPATPATLRDNPLEVLARASGGRVSPFAAMGDQVRLGSALADVGLVGAELEAFGKALAGDGAGKLWPKSEAAKARGSLTVGFFLGKDCNARMLVDGVARWREGQQRAAAPAPVVKTYASGPNLEGIAAARALVESRRRAAHGG